MFGYNAKVGDRVLKIAGEHKGKYGTVTRPFKNTFVAIKFDNLDYEYDAVPNFIRLLSKEEENDVAEPWAELTLNVFK